MVIIPYILLTALIHVESGGNDRALGDYVNGAPTRFGCLQIGDEVLADVRRISGQWVSRSDAFDRRKACSICIVYLSYWCDRERLGHEPTMEDFARTWNGGPTGPRKVSTITYWNRVRAVLNQISPARLPVGGDQRKTYPVAETTPSQARVQPEGVAKGLLPDQLPPNRINPTGRGYFSRLSVYPRPPGAAATSR